MPDTRTVETASRSGGDPTRSPGGWASGRPRWLTGGPTGLEASVFIFVVLAIAFPLFHLRHPVARFTPRRTSGNGGGEGPSGAS